MLRRWRFWFWIGLAATLVLLVVGFLAAVPLSSDTLRHRMVATLSDLLDSDVTVGDLHVRALPALHAEGADLVVRRRGAGDAPPLIAIKRFTADASVVSLWRRRVTHVTISGLDISIAPDHNDAGVDKPNAPEPRADDTEVESAIHSMAIDTLDADDARLIILPDEKKKPPKI